ncbi:hypothetical protein ABLO03_07295 [Mycobacterium tuberculosis]
MKFWCLTFSWSSPPDKGFAFIVKRFRVFSCAASFEDLSRRSRPAPETAGEAGDGVWAIYTVDADGGARVEQVYATELDALRANKDNTDPKRKVRFLPYGIAVSVLDDPVDEAQ